MEKLDKRKRKAYYMYYKEQNTDNTINYLQLIVFYIGKKRQNLYQ